MSHMAIVGATGLVGSAFLNLLQETHFPVSKLSLFASEKNSGKTIQFKDQSVLIQTLQEGCFEEIDMAFFSAGGKRSVDWARQAGQQGCTVIDNSSAFRMHPDVPLVIPEINASVLNSEHKLIANPNCSTIQMCLALNPLHRAYGLKSVQVATYQSMSGAGLKPLNHLKEETQECLNQNKNSGKSAFNCIPQIGEIEEDGFSVEDLKMQNETRKILNHPQLNITAFTVRVPTLISHGEVLWVTLDSAPQSRKELIQALQNQEGLKVMENIQEYPDNTMATDTNLTYVGRIHQVPQDSHTWMMWVCADNLRKGAALNGLQIAQYLEQSF